MMRWRERRRMKSRRRLPASMVMSVSDLEAGEGDEYEDLDSYGFRDNEVDEKDEREREEEDEAAEEAIGFNGDKCLGSGGQRRR